MVYEKVPGNQNISFEYETPSLEGFEHRIEQTLRRYPHLVIEEQGRILGYAYAGPFKTRAAYDRSCEMTIYLDRDCHRQGLGRLLYEKLEEELKRMGMTNLYACVAYPDASDSYLTTNSADFHEHMGYRREGFFTHCAYKFGRWYNMIWMEKIVGES